MNMCCHNCFKDKEIKSLIKTNGKKGTCDYCNSKDVYIYDTSNVGEYIREGINKAYQHVEQHPLYPTKVNHESAENVFEILCNEEVFSEKIFNLNLEEILFNDLLTSSDISRPGDGVFDILKNGEAHMVTKDLYVVDEESNKFTYSWNSFKYQIKHYNRYFDIQNKDSLSSVKRENMLNPIEKLLNKVEFNLEKGSEIWRARVGENELPDNYIKAIGPPPVNKQIIE